jgi:hypothetical protein
MGGESSTSQTQKSQTDPWAAAQPALQGILGQLQGQIGNAGLSGAQSGAIDQLAANAAKGNPYAPAIGSYAGELLNGGGATNQAGNVNQNYLDYRNATQPLASNTNYDPMQTPGLGQQLQTLKDDIGQSVNGQFEAGGRGGSNANQMAYGRGIAQGLAPVITGQYNINRDAQQGAAGNLYNAGNTNAGILSGMQQQSLANKGQGVTAAGQALDANNYGANATLQAEALRTGIPAQQLGLLAQIGIPIAGLGSTSSGTSNGTQQMSGAQQFGMIANGTGNLFKSFFPGGL